MISTEGMLNLCHALAKLERAGLKLGASPQPNPVLRFQIRTPSRTRPDFARLEAPKKPIQTEFDWPTNQLRLFCG